ncbi:MAG: ABC transporter ATP-binding protein [Bacteroidales bacterium]
MLELKDISVSFPQFSLQDINLQVEDGDYFTILGVSGAGKTLLLEIIAGLIKPSNGQILFKGEDISKKSIQDRKIGLVYQDLSLFPHMKVSQNILYPLKNKKLTKAEKQKLLIKLAGHMEISHLLDRYPGTLSGGEAQRTALARTLASDPDVLLLDEPLANLDIKLKSDIRQLLKKINKSGKTIIHVTHDYTEAATLSNKIAVIENGVLLQTGSPDEVFRYPKNEFVARFSGYRNLFPAVFENPDSKDGLNKATVSGDFHINFLGNVDYKKGFVIIPEQDIILSTSKLETSAINQFYGKVSDYYSLDFGTEVIIDAGIDISVKISNESFHNLKIEKGKNIWINFKASAVRVLKA